MTFKNMKEGSEPLYASNIKEWKEAKIIANKLEDKITTRIDYILLEIFEISGQEVDGFNWYFYGAEEGEVGDLDLSYPFDENDYIGNFVYGGADFDSVKAILKNGAEWNLTRDGVPARWLVEDFEEELIAGIKKYKKMEEDKAQKRKEKKAKKETEAKKLIESAKKKLTKEELRAIKNG